MSSTLSRPRSSSVAGFQSRAVGYHLQGEREFEVFELHHRYFVFLPESIFAVRIEQRLYDQLREGDLTGEAAEFLDGLFDAGVFEPVTITSHSDLRDHAGVTLMNTNLCNLRCPYCVMDHERRERQQPMMTWETARAAIDYLFDEFGRDAEHLTVGFSLTGEPLLNLGLLEQVAVYVRQREKDDGRPCRLYFSTNGTLVSEKVVELVRQFRVRVNVSIDGERSGHDLVRYDRMGRGTYDAALRGALRLNAHADEIDLTFSPTLTAANHDVTSSFESLWSAGARVIVTKPVRGPASEEWSFDASSVESLQDSYDRFAQHLLALEDGELLPRLLAILPPHNDYFGRMLAKTFLQTVDVFRCEAGKSDIAVDADGRIYSCYSVVGQPEMLLGQLTEEAPALLNESFCQMAVSERDPCRSCPVRHTCGGGCSCTAFQANGDKFVPDPIDCTLQMFLTRLAIYFADELAISRQDVYARVHRHLLETSERAA